LGAILPELQRFLPVLGRNNQAQPYMFMNAVWYVRTAEYLDETEMKCQLESFILPGNVSEDYIQQFINVRKVPTKNRRTGDTIVTWEKIGRCDYRYADVHAFICLDLPNDFGTFRRRLEEKDFKFNPYELDYDKGTGTMIKSRDRSDKDRDDEDEDYNDDGDDFTVGQLNW